MDATSPDAAAEDHIYQQINRTLRVLLAQEGRTVREQALRLGLSKSAMYDRMKLETMWSVAEVRRAATDFGVPIAWFLDGIPGLKGSSSRLPESNWGPSHYKSRPWATALRLVSSQDAVPTGPASHRIVPLMSIVRG